MKKSEVFILLIVMLIAIPVFSQNDDSDESAKENKETKTTIAKDNKKRGYHLGKVVVSATRTKKTVGAAPASVSVVSEEDMDVNHVQFFDQAINKLPGVYVNRRKFADVTLGINIRGFTDSSHNLIMWNGMPLTDGYSNNVTIPSISSDNIDRIEVVKGPFSSLYGRNALGGVVNIITKVPEKRDVTAKASYGSYNTFAGHVHVADRFFKNKLGVYLSFDYKSTDGQRTNHIVKDFDDSDGGSAIPVSGMIKTTDDAGNQFSGSNHPYYIIGDQGQNYVDQWITSGKLTYDFTSTTKLSLDYNIHSFTYGYRDAQSYLKDSNGTPITEGNVTVNYEGTDYYLDVEPDDFLPYFAGGERFNMYYLLGFETKFDDIDFKTKVGWHEKTSWYVKSGDYYNTGDGEINYTSPTRMIMGDAQFDIPLAFGAGFMAKKHILTIGTSVRYDHSESESRDVPDWTDPLENWGTKHEAMEGDQIFPSLFAQLELGLVKDYLTIYTGVRYDHWVNFGGYAYDSAGSPTTKNYETTHDFQVSPKIAVVYKPGLKLGDNIFSLDTVRASYGMAFNPPTIYQLYKQWSGGSYTNLANPELQPETSHSWEAGVSFSFLDKMIVVSGTYFGSVIQDLVEKTVIATGPPELRQEKNIGSGVIHGFESDVRVYILDFLEVFGNFTYTYTEITEALDPLHVGKAFTEVPMYMANTGINVHWKYITGSVTFRYVDKIYADADNGDTATGTYGVYDDVYLLDMKITGKPYEGVSLTFGIDNILDYQYYQYYKSPGRTFYGEAKIQL